MHVQSVNITTANILEGADDTGVSRSTRNSLVGRNSASAKRCRMTAWFALDNGVYKIWFARNYRAHQPNTVLLDNALATMGAGPAIGDGCPDMVFTRTARSSRSAAMAGS